MERENEEARALTESKYEIDGSQARLVDVRVERCKKKKKKETWVGQRYRLSFAGLSCELKRTHEWYNENWLIELATG